MSSNSFVPVVPRAMATRNGAVNFGYRRLISFPNGRPVPTPSSTAGPVPGQQTYIVLT